MRGQVLVELALALPVMLAAALGFCEAGMLIGTWAQQGRTTGALASWAALHPSEAPGPSWDALVAAEAPGCTSVLSVDAPDMLRLALTCRYVPIITRNLWDGLPMTTEAIGAVVVPSPSPSEETP